MNKEIGGIENVMVSFCRISIRFYKRCKEDGLLAY